MCGQHTHAPQQPARLQRVLARRHQGQAQAHPWLVRGRQQPAQVQAHPWLGRGRRHQGQAPVHQWPALGRRHQGQVPLLGGALPTKVWQGRFAFRNQAAPCSTPMLWRNFWLYELGCPAQCTHSNDLMCAAACCCPDSHLPASSMHPGGKPTIVWLRFGWGAWVRTWAGVEVILWTSQRLHKRQGIAVLNEEHE